MSFHSLFYSVIVVEREILEIEFFVNLNQHRLEEIYISRRCCLNLKKFYLKLIQPVPEEFTISEYNQYMEK